MKLYIKPNIELLEALPCALLEGSKKEDDQDVEFGAKNHNGWSFDEDDHDTNAWSDGFSAWD